MIRKHGDPTKYTARVIAVCLLKPQTLNPVPSTLNPQPSTLTRRAVSRSALCHHTADIAGILQRALPTETKDESGTSQIKSGTSVNLSNSEKKQE